LTSIKLKLKKLKIKLLIRAITNKIPETTLIFVVVLDKSKFIPILKAKVMDRKIKLPMLKNS
jgi:hypothetical protein